MKTYFIDRVHGTDVEIMATSINDLEQKAITICEKNVGGRTRIYVHCSHVCSDKIDEHNVEYLIHINTAKKTITTRRI